MAITLPRLTHWVKQIALFITIPHGDSSCLYILGLGTTVWDKALPRLRRAKVLEKRKTGQIEGGINSKQNSPYLAFSDFLFSPPINTPGTIQVNGYRKTSDHNQCEAPFTEQSLTANSCSFWKLGGRASQGRRQYCADRVPRHCQARGYQH